MAEGIGESVVLSLWGSQMRMFPQIHEAQAFEEGVGEKYEEGRYTCIYLVAILADE